MASIRRLSGPTDAQIELATRAVQALISENAVQIRANPPGWPTPTLTSEQIARAALRAAAEEPTGG